MSEGAIQRDGEPGSPCPQCGEPQLLWLRNSQERIAFTCGPCLEVAKARSAELIASMRRARREELAAPKASTPAQLSTSKARTPARSWWRWLSPNPSSGS